MFASVENLRVIITLLSLIYVLAKIFRTSGACYLCMESFNWIFETKNKNDTMIEDKNNVDIVWKSTILTYKDGSLADLA